MPRGARYLTDEQLIVIGRRHNCDEVGAEAGEALGRWRRDLPTLSRYGHGATVLAAFEADMARHADLRAARPEAVTGKRTAVVARDEHVSQAWAWVDRVKGVLGVPACSDPTIAMALDDAEPATDAGLEPGIRAMASLLSDVKSELPPEVEADQRLAEVETLSAALRSSPATVQTSRSQTHADTAQIDLLDGKLYQRIRALNTAGRAAIRNGDLQASAHEYMLHRLKRSGNPAPVTPTPPAPVPVAPTPSAPAREPSSTR